MLLKLKDSFFHIQDFTLYDNTVLSNGIIKRARSIPYTFFLISSVILAWGYFLTHAIVCIDSLSGDRYSSGMLLGQNRLTAPIISFILKFGSEGITDYFFGNMLGIILLALGITITCSVLENVYKPKSDIPLIIFACLYATYPLMYEYFTFGGTLGTGVCIVLNGIALHYVSSHKGFLKGFLIPSVLLMFSVSSYEAFILPYIALTALILILTVRYKDISQSDVFKTGIKYALPLVFGIIIKINLGFIFQAIFGVADNFNADKSSAWLITGDINTNLESFKIFFDSFVISWIAKAFCFTPITIISVFAVIGIAVFIADFIKHKKPILILLYGILFLSIFAFTIYRCKVMACRMEQGFPAFIASISYLILLELQSFKKKGLYTAVSAVLTVLVLNQCVCSGQWVRIEDLRYQEEKQVLLNIVDDIRRDYDVSKPVVFIGEYNLSKNITEKTTMKEGSVAERICTKVYENDIHIDNHSYKICDTLARSYLAWAVRAFDEPGTEIFKFLKFENCQLVQCTEEQYQQAVGMYEQLPSYPSSGYIYDAGDFLVVKLG